jgi:hypothetical protein
MKTTISTAVAFALLAGTAAYAQTSSTSDPNGPGQSARCDTLSGAERDQCLRDENAKTQNAPADANAPAGSDASATTGSDSSATGSDSSTSGSSAPASGDASSSSADKAPQDTTGDKLPATKSE